MCVCVWGGSCPAGGGERQGGCSKKIVPSVSSRVLLACYFPQAIQLLHPSLPPSVRSPINSSTIV